MKVKSIIILFFFSLLAISCNEKELHNTSQNILACVHDSYLHKKEVQHILAYAKNQKDSSKFIKKYIKNWISKKLFLAEAKKYPIDYEKIERQVTAYKNQLIIDRFFAALLAKSTNPEINEEAIIAYYTNNRNNFTLKNHLLKGALVIIPNNAPYQQQLVSLLSKQDSTKLLNYCKKYARSYILPTDTWQKFSIIMKNTPFNTITEKQKIKILKHKNVTKLSDKNHTYYCFIKEYKLQGQTTPIELLQNNIKNILLHKHKMQLLDSIKSTILEKEKNTYTVYDY